MSTEEDKKNMQDALDEKRAEELMKTFTNKDKRAAIKHFDMPYTDLDGFDQLVVLAHLADRSRSFADYDELPMDELMAVIRGK